MLVWIKNKIEGYVSGLEGVYLLKHLTAACHPHPLRYLITTGIAVALVYLFACLMLYRQITDTGWWHSADGQFSSFLAYWVAIISAPFLIAMVQGYRHRNDITGYITNIPQYKSASKWRRLVLMVYAVIRFGGFVIICIYLAKKAIDFVQAMILLFL